MTLLALGVDDMLQTGEQPEGGVVIVAELPRDRIRRAEADSADLVHEAIRVLADGRDGAVAVLLVNAERARAAKAVGGEKDHQIADAVLLVPVRLDLVQPALPHAAKLEQTLRLLVEDPQEIDAKPLDEPLGQRRADPLHVAGREVLPDALGARRNDQRDRFGDELAAPFSGRSVTRR